MRRSFGLAAVLLSLGLTSAARADIRDDSFGKGGPAPSPPPATEPRAEKQGCAGRQMAPEWLFGMGVLVLGLGGMRRYRARHAAAT
jgi:hypothetical protein